MKYLKLTFLGIFISLGLITQAQSFEEEIKELKKQARLNYNEGVRFAKYEIRFCNFNLFRI